MNNHRDLLDIIYIDHWGNKKYKNDFLESLNGRFSAFGVPGRDLNVEYGRRGSVAAATKDFVMLADADDLYLPETLEDMVDFLVANPDYDACCATDVRFLDNCVPKVVRRLRGREPKDMTYELAAKGPLVMHNCVIWRTSVLREFLVGHKSSGNLRGFDYEMRLDFLQNKKKVRSLPLIGVLYRERSDGANHRALVSQHYKEVSKENNSLDLLMHVP